MTDGHVIRWAEGTVSGNLNDSGVIWKRVDSDRRWLTYGLLREPAGGQEFEADVSGMVVLFVPVRSEADIALTLQFARSLTSTPAPCIDCVVPGRR
jgi:hypothetical protein